MYKIKAKVEQNCRGIVSDKSQPSAVHVAPESLLMKATSLTMSNDEPSDTEIRRE
jgi:hypothetical protein